MYAPTFEDFVAQRLRKQHPQTRRLFMQEAGIRDATEISPMHVAAILDHCRTLADPTNPLSRTRLQAEYDDLELMPPSRFNTIRRLNRAAILAHRDNDRCWANDMIFKATSAVLDIDIAIVDEREPHDRVQIALRAEAEAPGFVIPTRSWRGELLPRLLRQQHELATSGRMPATPLVVLHWVTNGQHYEPALPIEPPIALPSPPRSPASRVKSTDDEMDPDDDEQPEGSDRPLAARAARRTTKAPATRSTTQCQEHSHTLTNTTGAQYPLTRARCVASPATTHHTTTEGQSPAPSTIATRSASTSPPSPQPPQAPASSIAPKPHPRKQPRDARHRDHGNNANASTPTTRPVTRKTPAHAASTTPSHPQHTRTAATPARQRTGPEESALSSITPLSRTTRAMARFASPAHAASHAQPSAPHQSAARELAPPDRLNPVHTHVHAHTRVRHVGTLLMPPGLAWPTRPPSAPPCPARAYHADPPRRPIHLSAPTRSRPVAPHTERAAPPACTWRPDHPPPSSPPPPSGGGGGPIPAASVFERYAGVSTTS